MCSRTICVFSLIILLGLAGTVSAEIVAYRRFEGDFVDATGNGPAETLHIAYPLCPAPCHYENLPKSPGRSNQPIMPSARARSTPKTAPFSLADAYNQCTTQQPFISKFNENPMS
jgi:hypothetical protein